MARKNLSHRASEGKPRFLLHKYPLRGLLAAALALSAVLLSGAAGCAGTAPEQPGPAAPSAGLFSWKSSVVNKTDDEIFSIMEKQGLNALYQVFSVDNNKHTQVVQFLTTAKEKGVSVYYLAGDASWSKDKEGKKLCEAVEQAMSYNRKAKRAYLKEHPKAKEEDIPRLTGLVFDVEPYLLKEWDKDPAKLMKSFASGAGKAYELAKKNDLRVILCVPWFYDTKGQEKGLETLVRDCCDGIAVMNYYRGSEIANIAAEAKLAQQYKKDLISIYELQEADDHGLKEINTYYKEGLDALRENYQALREAYPDQCVSMALHEYKALKEVLEK